MSYIIKLMESKVTDIELSSASFFTLYQFGTTEYLSTYQVFKLLKKTQYRSGYENDTQKSTKPTVS